MHIQNGLWAFFSLLDISWVFNSSVFKNEQLTQNTSQEVTTAPLLANSSSYSGVLSHNPKAITNLPYVEKILSSTTEDTFISLVPNASSLPAWKMNSKTNEKEISYPSTEQINKKIEEKNPRNFQIACPSTKALNKKIREKSPMEFQISGIKECKLEYRNSGNEVVKMYDGEPVKELDSVYIQKQTDQINASASCLFKTTKNKYFTLAVSRSCKDNIDTEKMNTGKNGFSAFYNPTLFDCPPLRMPESQIIKNCKIPMKGG